MGKRLLQADMLKLLLDEHISPRVADGIQRKSGEVVVIPISRWQNGNLLGQEDALVLREAAEHGLTLVTYDRRTIPPLLKQWAEEGQKHGGVVFVDDRTISPSNIGGLVSALTVFWREARLWDWAARIYFLSR